MEDWQSGRMRAGANRLGAETPRRFESSIFRQGTTRGPSGGRGNARRASARRALLRRPGVVTSGHISGVLRGSQRYLTLKKGEMNGVLTWCYIQPCQTLNPKVRGSSPRRSTTSELRKRPNVGRFSHIRPVTSGHISEGFTASRSTTRSDTASSRALALARCAGAFAAK